ncbi:hypothetical protein [Roseateles depolymerans]|uniref:Uncharacterized protein n=1 Tax=Roseateles depolymerans TaxID=76731 RepID=A0A0U3CK17_9BURK|nr:hypothetical protein [Roseateles depolymerans]ALV08952.1 hypothetical protein RD2015_4511 [Roseateles depolymerans]REG09386.1 hypothetical protein DES44_4799 [Roseateles depolymerans]
MGIQEQLKDALISFLESGDATEIGEIIASNPDLVSFNCGDYPDVHRVMDLQLNGKSFRVCRQLSRAENITLTPIDEPSETPGVPLWLTGERLMRWATDETENPADEPTDWSKYR